MARSPTTVVFDLGGVLIDWNPRHLYRKLFEREEEMERFLAEVCTGDWNGEQDRGRPFAEAARLLIDRHPGQAAMVEAFFARWPEMLNGPIQGTVAVLEELHAAGVPLFALTNWSAETGRWRGRSSRSSTASAASWCRASRPDQAGRGDLSPAMPRLRPGSGRFGLHRRFPRNVEAAEALGFHAHHFRGPEALRGWLAGHGLPPER